MTTSQTLVNARETVCEPVHISDFKIQVIC